MAAFDLTRFQRIPNDPRSPGRRPSPSARACASSAMRLAKRQPSRSAPIVQDSDQRLERGADAALRIIMRSAGPNPEASHLNAGSHPYVARQVDVGPAVRIFLIAPPAAGETEGELAESHPRDMRADAPLAEGFGSGERDFGSDEDIVPNPIA